MSAGRRPLIGINCKLATEKGDRYYKLDRNYVRSIEKAGGTPVLMPFFGDAAGARAFIDLIDGILLTGGPDLNPRRWGEKPHPKTKLLDPERETSDFFLLKEILSRDLPALAICCGMQELNVAMKGSLHQHLDGHSGGVTHAIGWKGTSRTRDIVGPPSATVNSWHHQACNAVGRGLRVTALSPEGVVEGIESDRHRFVVGVQWHPERMADDSRQLSLFRALVSSSKC